ncbi:MAG: BrnT family toxin [Melioribacteraceae bacterium]|nr:BrnT family toxin [Melioribacteraceae bacterium]
MKKTNFEWDEVKNVKNQNKHKISFDLAQYAFADSKRIIAKDIEHSKEEDRYYCFGKVTDEIVTVRFTYRKHIIRIIGAGYWRKGKRIYEKENKI